MKTKAFFLLVFLLAVSSCNTGNRSPKAGDTDITPDSLFSMYYHDRLSLNPLMATSMGLDGYDDQFRNFISEEFILEFEKFCEKYERLASSFDPDDLDEQQYISLQLVGYTCRLRRKGLQLPIPVVPLQLFEYPELSLMPVNQFGSFLQCMGTSLYGQQPFKTGEDYLDWMKRLEGFMEWMDTAMNKMRSAAGEGVVLPKIIVDRVLAQIGHAVTEVESNMYYEPVLQMPGTIGKEDSIRIAGTYRAFLEERLIPKFSELHAFLEEEYLPLCRDSHGLGAVPGGMETYKYLVEVYTGTTMTPDEIFDIGEKEVVRISAEMEGVMQKVGFDGTLEQFLEFIPQNEALRPFKTREEVIAHFYDIYERMKPQMDRLFDLKVNTGFEVRRTEPFREAGASMEMVPGIPGGKRKTVFYVPIPEPADYTIFSDESAFLHEMYPGHHYQIMLQRENMELPEFQRSFTESFSFEEGWALYAESLGTELGLFKDPYMYFGMLNEEMHRAIRLVVDAGIHARGWSREQAIEYSLAHEAFSKEFITSEIERYIAWPGQALSYKIGQLKLLEFSKRAEAALGDQFDLSEFHTQILNSGSIPLEILEEKIDRWLRQSLDSDSITVD